MPDERRDLLRRPFKPGAGRLNRDVGPVPPDHPIELGADAQVPTEPDRLTDIQPAARRPSGIGAHEGGRDPAHKSSDGQYLCPSAQFRGPAPGSCHACERAPVVAPGTPIRPVRSDAVTPDCRADPGTFQPRSRSPVAGAGTQSIHTCGPCFMVLDTIIILV